MGTKNQKLFLHKICTILPPIYHRPLFTSSLRVSRLDGGFVVHRSYLDRTQKSVGWHSFFAEFCHFLLFFLTEPFKVWSNSGGNHTVNAPNPRKIKNAKPPGHAIQQKVVCGLCWCCRARNCCRNPKPRVMAHSGLQPHKMPLTAEELSSDGEILDPTPSPNYSREIWV